LFVLATDRSESNGWPRGWTTGQAFQCSGSTQGSNSPSCGWGTGFHVDSNAWMWI